MKQIQNEKGTFYYYTLLLFSIIPARELLRFRHKLIKNKRKTMNRKNSFNKKAKEKACKEIRSQKMQRQKCAAHCKEFVFAFQ